VVRPQAILVELSEGVCGGGALDIGFAAEHSWAGLVVSSDSGRLATELGIETLVTQQSDLEAWLAGVQGFGDSGVHVGSAAAHASAPEGSVVVIWGPHGSPGRTTIAITVAGLLSRTDPKVVLVDADTYGPSITLALNLEAAQSGLVQAARMARVEGVTAAAIVAAAAIFAGRNAQFPVLTGILGPEKYADIEELSFRRVLSTLRQDGYTVVVDVAAQMDQLPGEVVGAPIRNSATLSALELADQVVVVTRPSALATKRLVRAWPQLQESAPRARFIVFANAVSAARARQADEAAYSLWQLCGIEKVHVLPDESELVARAENEAVTLLDLPGQSKLLSVLAAVFVLQSPARARGPDAGSAPARRRFSAKSVWNTLFAKRLP
jgi:MinD-like ATPase involved in chromosome partitioning or flagellar assembly